MASYTWVKIGSGNGLVPGGITWTSVDSTSVRSCGIQRGHYHKKIWICQSVKKKLKIIFLKSHPDLLGANKFNEVWILAGATHCSVGSFVLQYIPKIIHTEYILCVMWGFCRWRFYLCPLRLLHWHCGSSMIAQVKQPWRIWVNKCPKSTENYNITWKQQTQRSFAHIFHMGYDEEK